MPIESQVDWDRRLVNTRCSGTISLADFIDYQDGVWRDFSLYGFNELFDATEADFSQLTFSELLTVARRAADIKALAPSSKMALLLTEGRQTKLTEFYISAKGMLPVKSRQMKIFYSRDEAQAWLED